MDICYSTTSDYGTDITLKDRQKLMIEGNIIVCQEDCEFSDYLSNSLKAECTCKVKESSSSLLDININKKKLFENFKNVKNFKNFNILFCYKKLFNLKSIMNNIDVIYLQAFFFFI